MRLKLNLIKYRTFYGVPRIGSDGERYAEELKKSNEYQEMSDEVKKQRDMAIDTLPKNIDKLNKLVTEYTKN